MSIRAEQTFAIELDAMGGRIGNPDFCLPSDVLQMIRQSRAVGHDGYKQQPGLRSPKKSLQFGMTLNGDGPMGCKGISR
jgi:hypothetical protein